jgi:Asp-tRNA(Asn)/Glu-tRNA(Gln) amidotransferase A subunit family amidase
MFMAGQGVRIEEASIDSLLAAYQSRKTEVRSVVRAYLDRIEAYDRKGPALSSIITVNPDAMAQAEELDTGFARSKTLTGPLHGIPVLVKDNVDVAGLPTTGGSRALMGWVPPRDATIVAKLRAAGAIVIAKTSMSEFARGGVDNINSVLPGFARNPYNTAYATGGSSGGTGAALAANFGVIGIGSDTWGSIRNPANNNSIVGLRPSSVIASRAGMTPAPPRSGRIFLHRTKAISRQTACAASGSGSCGRPFQTIRLIPPS